MREINVGGYFKKLHKQNTGKLIHVFSIPIKSLDKDLINYDSQIDGETFSFSHKGTVIVLIMLGEKNIPYTIMRKYSARDLIRYQNAIGETFQLAILIEAGKIFQERLDI